MRSLVLVPVLILSACGGGGGGAPDSWPTVFVVDTSSDLGGYAGLTTAGSVLVIDSLADGGKFLVLLHELLHTAGMHGHPVDDGCLTGDDGEWPPWPCPRDIEYMRSIAPERIQLRVADPDLWGPTDAAAQTWNQALDRALFEVVAN